MQPDIPFARLQHLLAGAVALHLGRRRIDAHQLERDPEAAPVVEPDFEHPRALVHGDAGGLRCVRCEAGHDAR